LQAGGIVLPTFSPTQGLALSFLLARTSSSRVQTILSVTTPEGNLVHVSLDDGQIVLDSDYLNEAKVSAARLIPGALRHLIVDIEPQRIKLFIDGSLDSSFPTYMYSWTGL